MRAPFLIALTVISGGLAAPAHAHLGHVGELAGHSHWIAIGAVAVAIGLVALAGKNNDDEAPEDAECEDAPQGDTSEA